MENCNGKVEAISEMLDGELEVQREAELRAHIAQCKTCKKIYDAFAAISDAVGEGLVEPPEMLVKGIMFKIESRKNGGGSRRFAFGRFTAVAACLAVILLGASHFGLLDSTKTASPDPAAMNDEAAVAPADGEAGTQQTISEDFSLDLPSQDYNSSTNAPLPEAKLGGDGAIYQFGNITGNPSTFGALQEGRMLDAAKKEIAVLLMDSAEISVYNGEYADADGNVKTENLYMTISSRETLEALSALFVFTTPDEDLSARSAVADGKPAFTLVIPKDDSSSDRMEDITVSIWFADRKIICTDSKSSLHRFAVGSMDDFLKLIDSEKQAQKIM